MPLTLASNAITFTDNTSLSSGIIGTAQLSAGAVTFDKISQSSGPFSFRNKIINGDMRVSQRNGNNAISVPLGNTYPVDRFIAFTTIASTYTVQRLSADGPGPVTSSIRCTLNTTRSPAAGDVFGVVQYIEAQNIYDLQYGTANARPITLSFWVKASTTGTYGARVIFGSTTTVSYVYTYTINQANTWEYKTVTIPGNTTQALNPDPIGIGMDILWNLGAGTTRRTSTTNQWIAGDFHSATGTVSFVELSPGATWQITGVQLEVGPVATPFEQRPIGLELSLCQRYFCKSYRQSDAPGTVTDVGYHISFCHNTFTLQQSTLRWPVSMRTNPDAKLYSSVTGTIDRVRDRISNTDRVCSIVNIGETGAEVNAGGNFVAGNYVTFHWTANAEL